MWLAWKRDHLSYWDFCLTLKEHHINYDGISIQYHKFFSQASQIKPTNYNVPTCTKLHYKMQRALLLNFTTHITMSCICSNQELLRTKKMANQNINNDSITTGSRNTTLYEETTNSNGKQLKVGNWSYY